MRLSRVAGAWMHGSVCGGLLQSQRGGLRGLQLQGEKKNDATLPIFVHVQKTYILLNC